MRRFLFICTVFSVLVFSIPSASEDLTQIYKNSVSRQPYVLFSARDGSPGHSFVILGEELDGALLFQLGVFGFYPKDGKKVAIKALFGTDGQIDYRWDDMEADVRFRHNINADQQDKVNAVLEKWRSNDYSLLNNNCNSLAREVALAVGLKVPSANPGTTFPINYMTELKLANDD